MIKINYGDIFVLDCANGPGLRTSLFVSGCTHHCKGCFNEKTWDFAYGKPYDAETEHFITMTLMYSAIDGLSVLGGEPMELPNQAAIVNLLREARALGKTIWIYSGYTFEELTDRNNKRCHGPYTDEILSLIDVLVDGEFVEEEKDISLLFRGSRNQRILDVQNSLIAGEAIWKEEYR